jgi:hypothetical protein
MNLRLKSGKNNVCLFINVTQHLVNTVMYHRFLNMGTGRFHNHLCDCYLLWRSFALVCSVLKWYPSNFWYAECIVSCSLVFPDLWLITLAHLPADFVVLWATANLPPRVWVYHTTVLCCGWWRCSFKVNICEDLLFHWADRRGRK